MKIELLESEVEDVIFEGQLLEDHGIKCIGRQVRFGSAGIVDILGYDTTSKRWVIIEIKRGNLCAKAYAQGMRYRNWLSNYQLNKQIQRGADSNAPLTADSLPYVLLIGDSLCDELRFLTHAPVDKFHGDSCYMIFNIEPRLTLGCSYNSNAYRWNMQEDFEASTNK